MGGNASRRFEFLTGVFVGIYGNWFIMVGQKIADSQKSIGWFGINIPEWLYYFSLIPLIISFILTMSEETRPRINTYILIASLIHISLIFQAINIIELSGSLFYGVMGSVLWIMTIAFATRINR